MSGALRSKPTHAGDHLNKWVGRGSSTGKQEVNYENYEEGITDSSGNSGDHAASECAGRCAGRASAGLRGWYGPGWYNPYWGPYYPYGAYAYPNTGEVKIDTKVKDAQVFINGAYAGATHDNKTMHLRPGSYAIEIREGERTQFSQQIYVALGKTVHLHPAL